MQVKRFKTEFVAGFFDGEGCIYLNKNRVKKKVGDKEYCYPELQLVIGQSGDIGKEILGIIKNQYGFGKLREVEKLSSFKATKPAYMIQTSGKNALKILKELEPHLFVKAAKAREAIEFMENYYAS